MTMTYRHRFALNHPKPYHNKNIKMRSPLNLNLNQTQKMQPALTS